MEVFIRIQKTTLKTFKALNKKKKILIGSKINQKQAL